MMKKLHETRIKRIFTLLGDGYSRSAVARIMGLDWHTVNDYAAQRRAAIDAARNAPIQQPINPELDNPDETARR